MKKCIFKALAIHHDGRFDNPLTSKINRRPNKASRLFSDIFPVMDLFHGIVDVTTVC